MRGYELAEALRREAEDTVNERRASVMRDAANEIERRIQEVRSLMAVIERIRNYPVHSEPVGGAMAMKDIAHEALYSPNDQAQ